MEYVNPGAKGIRVFIDVTDVGAGPGTVTVKVQNRDPASLNWVDVPEATSGAISTTGTTTLTLYPGQEEDTTAPVAVSEPLGVRWRLVATVATNAVTFSIGADYLDR